MQDLSIEQSRSRLFFSVIAFLCIQFMPAALVLSAADPVDGSHTFDKDDWQCWRGPDRNGIANPNQKPPLQWNENENIVWKADIPGRGHGSMTLVGDHVYLATAIAEDQTQRILSLKRETGKEVWSTVVHTGGFAKKGNERSSLASSTVACDGERLFINFLNAGAVHTTALTMNGDILWQKKITDYIIHQGYGSSPLIWKDLVIVSADNKGGGTIAGLDRKSGEIKWRVDRPKKPNYPSPNILNIGGKEQLIMTGCDLVTSLNPATGEKIWEIDGATTECVSTTVKNGDLIFTSGGYPDNHVSAVRADGSGKVVWRNKARNYVPSMLSKDGCLFAVLDAGIAICWDAQTGDELWKERLKGEFYASPSFVGETVFATNNSGTTFIFDATRNKFELRGTNNLGDETMSTPVFAGSRIYLRAAHHHGSSRQEVLYCIGEK